LGPKELVEGQEISRNPLRNSRCSHVSDQATTSRSPLRNSRVSESSQVSESGGGSSAQQTKSLAAACILKAAKSMTPHTHDSSHVGGPGPVLDMFAGATVRNLEEAGRAKYHEFLDTLQVALKYLSEGVREPAGHRAIDRFVNSWVFANWCALMIMLNAVFIAACTNYEMQQPGGGSTPVIKAVEYAFLIWYSIELLLKLAAHGRYFFVGPDYRWNWFDLFLVGVSAMQLVLLTGAANFSFGRSLRLFKITKIFRVFRFMEFFKDVKVMVLCMLQSFLAVFWCLLIIAFMMYFASVLILQAVIMHIETLESAEDIAWFQEQFPSVQEMMVVLFQSTTGGCDWNVPYNNILETENVWAQAFFLFYIAFFTIAVWNIVTGLFIEKAMTMVEPDKHEFMLRQRRAELHDIAELKGLFTEMDYDNSKSLSFAEFENICKVPEFRTFLEQRGILINEAGSLFSMIAQSTGNNDEIDIDTMIACFLRIKGMATSIDLHTLRFEVKSALRQQTRVLDDMKHFLAHVGVGVAETCTSVAARPVRTPNSRNA